MKKLLSLMLVMMIVLCGCGSAVDEGAVYVTEDGKKIKIVSKTELEMRFNKSSGKIETILCKYSIDGDKLRVIQPVMGTDLVIYFQVQSDKLVREGTGSIYSKKEKGAWFEDFSKKDK